MERKADIFQECRRKAKDSWAKDWGLDWQSRKAASVTEDDEEDRAFAPDAHLLSPHTLSQGLCF